MNLNLKEISGQLSSSLSAQELKATKVHDREPGGGFSYDIDGGNSVTTISFWPNGLCDVESICINTEENSYSLYDFSSTENAIEILLKEIKAAIINA